MELNKIEFKANYQVMTLSTKDVEISLNKSLDGLNGYMGSRIVVANNRLMTQVAFAANTTCIERNNIARVIGASNSIQLAPELREQWVGVFIQHPNVQETPIFEMKGRVIITLDSLLVLQSLVQGEDDNKIYQIGNLAELGDNVGAITIYQFEKEVVNRVKNMKPQGTKDLDDYNYDYKEKNEGHNNNRNQGNRNQGGHNNNRQHQNQGNRNHNQGNRQGGGKHFPNGGRPQNQGNGIRQY